MLKRFLLLTFCLTSVAAADPPTQTGSWSPTMASAAQLVASITNSDPATQSRMRADFAMKIVNARIDTANSVWGTALQTVPVDGIFGDSIKSRNEKLFENRTAQNSWDLKVGQCADHAAIMKEILTMAGENVTIMSSGTHTFPVVNLPPGADPDIPSTWGNAFIPDSWAGETVSAQDAWNNKMMFNGGADHCYTGLEAKGHAMPTREKIDKFLERGPKFLVEHPEEWQEMVDKLPPDQREALRFPDGTPAPTTPIQEYTEDGPGYRPDIIRGSYGDDSGGDGWNTGVIQTNPGSSTSCPGSCDPGTGGGMNCPP